MHSEHVQVTRHHTRKHHISTEELEAKLGIHDIRHYVHSRAQRNLGHVIRTDADRTPSLLQRCWVVDGKQPSGKTKVLYDSAVQKLLDEVELSLLDAANKSEWHNITKPEALAAQARAASGFSAQVAAQRPSAVTKGRGLHHPHHEYLAPRKWPRRQHANQSLLVG
jgi:hypothetical protein